MGDEQRELSGGSGIWDRAQQFSAALLRRGIEGVGPLKGAAEVAEEHLRDSGDSEEAIRRLVRTHVRLAATSGFATSFGGFTAMPVTLPAGVTGLYVIGTRLSAAIAYVRGYDLDSEEVRSAIMVTLLGSAGATALKRAGVEIGKRSTTEALCKLPGRVLIEINKKVGYRLITRFSETGVINLGKGIPLVGGVVGAGVDGAACRSIGAYARSAFPELPGKTRPTVIHATAERIDRPR
jgi:hypothetical protein